MKNRAIPDSLESVFCTQKHPFSHEQTRHAICNVTLLILLGEAKGQPQYYVQLIKECKPIKLSHYELLVDGKDLCTWQISIGPVIAGRYVWGKIKEWAGQGVGIGSEIGRWWQQTVGVCKRKGPGDEGQAGKDCGESGPTAYWKK